LFDPILFQKLFDSVLQLRLPFCGSVDWCLPVDIADVPGTVPDTQTELTGRQDVILLNTQAFSPPLVDQQVVFSLGFGGLWPEGNVNRIIAQPTDIVTAWETDVVGTELHTKAHIGVRKDLLRNAMYRVSVGMRLGVCTSLSDGRQDVNEMVQFD